MKEREEGRNYGRNTPPRKNQLSRGWTKAINGTEEKVAEEIPNGLRGHREECPIGIRREGIREGKEKKNWSELKNEFCR